MRRSNNKLKLMLKILEKQRCQVLYKKSLNLEWGKIEDRKLLFMNPGVWKSG